MTAVAAVLIIGGLLLAVLFVVGTVLFFGMMIHAEWSHAKANRTEEPMAVVEPLRTPAITATTQATRASA